MPSLIDLKEYFARIGYSGANAATLPVLQEVQRRHVCAIPFENLDIQLGRGISLNLPAIEQKLVRDRRGGYCFEQNTLLKAVLETIGFHVTALIGRVRWQIPAEIETAQTHMVLMVELEHQRFLVDGGFGSGSLTAPLLIDTEEEQSTPHEPRRILHRGETYIQQVRHGSEWADLYHFTLRPMLAVDYEVANWFTSTAPQSRFKQNLVAALTADGLRYTLLNREFTTRWIDGRSEKREIRSAEELLQVLAEPFSLSFPPGTRFALDPVLFPR
jgi:N-hydroxyarylamine O-acetyltransferase